LFFEKDPQAAFPEMFSKCMTKIIELWSYRQRKKTTIAGFKGLRYFPGPILQMMEKKEIVQSICFEQYKEVLLI
jgi:hypothetical protein